MQEFFTYIYNYFKESPSIVIEKALSLQYSYKDLFYIVFCHQKATADPFLEENLFMSEISIVPLESLFSALINIKEDMQTLDNQALLKAMFPA